MQKQNTRKGANNFSLHCTSEEIYGTIICSRLLLCINPQTYVCVGCMIIKTEACSCPPPATPPTLCAISTLTAWKTQENQGVFFNSFLFLFFRSLIFIWTCCVPFVLQLALFSVFSHPSSSINRVFSLLLSFSVPLPPSPAFFFCTLHFFMLWFFCFARSHSLFFLPQCAALWSV